MNDSNAHPMSHAKARAIKIALWFVGIVATLIVVGYAAFQVSPWPSALLIRLAFSQGGKEISAALVKHVPPNVASILNERYDPNDVDAKLDVYFPSEVERSDKVLSTVVWVHGGGWVAGSKEEIANYLKIIAAKGYAVVAVEYSLAPKKKYPTPVKQVNAALAYLANNTARLHVDSRFVLAGDSAGAQIVAQLANIITSPAYAAEVGIRPLISSEQLRGVLLYCGPYDHRSVNLDGEFGGFLKSILWSYSGSKDFMSDARFATLSVAHYVSASFPPTFISVGNADPLQSQSRALHDALKSKGVPVDALFFADDYQPQLPHEYQFNLDIDAGQLALNRSLEFLRSHALN
jgi:acetyl esterase